MYTPAIIYCRVSSAKQKKTGDGLRGQEKNCRSYCRGKGYSVVRVFDDDISGGSVTRAGFDAMLDFLDEQFAEGIETVVVIDDIKRFARDVINHYALKTEVYKRGGRLESPLFVFEDSPEGKFRETIFAAQAELERTQNARQVRRRMQAKLEQGLWTFSAVPPGLRYVRHPVYKKVLALDRQRAPLLKEAMQGLAGSQFDSAAEVHQFLNSRGFFGMSNRAKEKADIKCVHRMLRNVLYAGCVEYPRWGITRRKGFHPALITLKEFEAIQEKLAGRTVPLVRVDANRDFPLRNLVLCPDCGRPLTGSWSKGRSKSYAYYHCWFRGCVSYGKTVAKSALEDRFVECLKQWDVRDEVLDLVRLCVDEQWASRQAAEKTAVGLVAARKGEIEEEIDRLSKKGAATSSETMFKKLEDEIERLVAERTRLEAINSEIEEPTVDAGTAFETVRSFLGSPSEKWLSGDLHTKRTVFRMVFPAGISYDRNEGLGTAELSLPYRVLREAGGTKCKLVDPASKSWNRLNLEEHTVWPEFIATIQEWSDLVNG